MSTPPRAPEGAARSLLAPALAALVCLAILLGLGTWQLQRKAEKEGLIARILERSRSEPPAEPPAFDRWDPARDEFRRVRVTGQFLHAHETQVHGLAAGRTPGRARQGSYILTPLKRADGSILLVNRGFVSTERQAPETRAEGQVEGEATVTGMLRASEPRALFVPPPDPARGVWFHRDIAAIAAARGLEPVAPYLVEADATPNPGGWPQGGQLRVDLPNNHLQYAFTWFGLAGCLLAVFAAFAWHRVRGDQAPA